MRRSASSRRDRRSRWQFRRQWAAALPAQHLRPARRPRQLRQLARHQHLQQRLHLRLHLQLRQHSRRRRRQHLRLYLAPYAIAQKSAAASCTGTTDTGNHGDDTVTTIALPFPVQICDQIFTEVTLDSNGKAHFPIGSSIFGNGMFAQSQSHLHHFPLLGRSAHGCTERVLGLSRRNMRHLHVGFGHGAESHLQRRVADRLFRQSQPAGQFRAALIRSTDALRRDLRSRSQRQHQCHCWNPTEPGQFHPVPLQRVGWCG